MWGRSPSHYLTEALDTTILLQPPFGTPNGAGEYSYFLASWVCSIPDPCRLFRRACLHALRPRGLPLLPFADLPCADLPSADLPCADLPCADLHLLFLVSRTHRRVAHVWGCEVGRVAPTLTVRWARQGRAKGSGRAVPQAHTLSECNICGILPDQYANRRVTLRDL